MGLGSQGNIYWEVVLYGLGAFGEEGVEKVLQIIHKELDTTMALCGYRDIKDVNTNILEP